MKKYSAYAKSAVTLALVAGFGGAQAGNLAAASTPFAVENFGTTFNATTGTIQPGAATYTVGTTNGIVINAGGKIYLTVRLTGGTFKAAPLAASVTGTALDVGGAGNGVVSLAILSTDRTTAMFAITYTGAATLGVGSTLVYTPPAVGAGTAIDGVKAALAAVGGKVTATASLSAITPVVQAPSTTTAPNTGTAQAADIDGPAGTADLAVAVQAVTTAVSALPTYTGKIDLTASPAASNYALSATPGTPVVAKLGSVTFTNRTVAGVQLDGAAAFNVAAAIAGPTNAATIVVTPGAGQNFPVGSQLSVSTAADQCVTTVGALTAFTGATSTQAATLTVPAANTISGTAIEICLTKPSTGNLATPITPTIAATLSNTVVAATTAPSTATGTGYALGYNGAVVDTNGYWPAALSASGYSTYTRIINTGSVDTTIQAAFIPQNTGVPGTALTLGLPASLHPSNVLKAGASVTLNNVQVEDVLGRPGRDDRPRLRVSGQTNSLKVQTFMQAPDGTITETSSAQ